MRKNVVRLLIAVLLISVLGGCGKKEKLDYDFYSCELAGEWIQYRFVSENAFVFEKDKVTFSDGTKMSYKITQQDGEYHVSFGSVDLVFVRKGINGYSTGFLFDSTNTAFLRRSDLDYVPDLYQPSREGSTIPEPEVYDVDELNEMFHQLLPGSYSGIYGVFSEMSIGEGFISWRDTDGHHTEVQYDLQPVSYTDKICEIELNGEMQQQLFLEYREKIINDNHVGVIFVMTSEEGSDDVEELGALVKTEDEQLIPTGYLPERYTDDAYQYSPGNIRETELLFLEDVLAAGKWCGKKLTDLDVDMIYFQQSQSDLDFSGYLLRHKVSGQIYETGTIYIINMSCQDTGYDQLVSELTELYGKPDVSELPYSQADGNVKIAMFGADGFWISIRTASKWKDLRIVFTARS